VRETDLLVRLVPSARPQPELERHDLRTPVRLDDHHRAVGQDLAARTGGL
jgi:hypothetical protein